MRVFSRPRRWALWSLNAPAVVYVLSIIVAAPAVTLAELHWNGYTDLTGFVRLTVLLAAAIGYGEAFDRIERFRRFLGADTHRSNHLSVWTIAGVLVLPPGLACLLVVLIYLHVLFMAHRHQSARTYRLAFTGAVATLATAAAAQSTLLVTSDLHSTTEAGAAPASAIALATFLVLDLVLLTGGIYLAVRPPSIKAVLPDRESLLFEMSTEVLGVVTGQLLLFLPWLAPASCGGLVALHRASLVKQLQVAATTDSKTTLLNAAAWRDRALKAVSRAAREKQRVAVIVIDLDFFKRINDEYGHLVGDRVLTDVAHAIRSETRARDIVGRFGGEEFVVLIDGRAGAAHAIDIATRIRERIAALTHPEGMRVTATIGVAHGIPDEPPNLDELLAHADSALYAGKQAGRDRVKALALA
ncbi:MAG TPA: GGDEF domain-containing protein [Jatrophihabitans sp.]|nr:GGDEF domain-containing protein [Jatrophihabitans sp.]